MTRLLLLSLCLISLSGCGEDEILHYQVPKEKAAETKSEASKTADYSKASTASSHQGIAWTLPEGWTFEAGSGMRFGTFKFTSGDTPVECTLVRLGGAAGGLAPNVNRWRGQIGLADTSAEEINKNLETIKGKMGEFKLTKLINPDNAEKAILASIIKADSATIFVKIMTKSDVIDQVKESFKNFSASVHLAE